MSSEQLTFEQRNVLRDFDLSDWQLKAVQAWASGDGVSAYRGTMEIFTGGGKSLIALACYERALEADPDTKLAIVVPTEALAHQWRQVLSQYTRIPADRVGMLGAGKKDALTNHRVLVTLLNSARDRLPALAKDVLPLMLVIDECHRAGSPSNQRVLNTPARFRLGLSATPDREELDDAGQQIDYDDQVLGRKLGRVCFRFSLRDAREVGWLPSYVVHHHGITLADHERRDYDSLSSRIDDLTDELRDHGISRAQIMNLPTNSEPEVRKLASAWRTLTAQRKDLLYRAQERERVATHLVKDALSSGRARKTLLFNERIKEAEKLQVSLRSSIDQPVGLEHSELSANERNDVLNRFRTGDLPVLVSVKALVEGLDVPEIDIAISVAATSSVRQRIQSLGRALRRRFGKEGNDVRHIHLLYVDNTVDEEIYSREDWNDLIGPGSNRYLLWPFQSDEPESRKIPPRTPRPSEEQEWERLGRSVPTKPALYRGSRPEAEFHVDSLGNVTTTTGLIVTNPQNALEMVTQVKDSGGRFWITPNFRLVLTSGQGDERGLWIVGGLAERFRVEQASSPTEEFHSHLLAPGDDYPGPTDESNGAFHISQRRGGLIERRTGRNREFALDDETSPDDRAENARRLINAWSQTGQATHKFSINNLWHAWYRTGGKPRFLAEVPGGFLWPTDKE